MEKNLRVPKLYSPKLKLMNVSIPKSRNWCALGLLALYPVLLSGFGLSWPLKQMTYALSNLNHSSLGAGTVRNTYRDSVGASVILITVVSCSFSVCDSTFHLHYELSRAGNIVLRIHSGTITKCSEITTERLSL